jgi:hypothetical protein
MADVLDTGLAEQGPAADWLKLAIGPRAQYASWLEAKIQQAGKPEVSPASEFEAVDDVFVLLIAMIEQAMAHAFVHYNRGNRQDADVAWATSGVAMTKSALLVRTLAPYGRTPKAGTSDVMSIREDPASALVQDRKLAACCAKGAAEAAQKLPDKLARRCADFADFANTVANHDGEGPHPSQVVTTPAFSSFQATFDRFVA